MIVVGYDKAYADSGKGHRSVYGNIRVVKAIRAIDAKHEATTDHNRDNSIKMLQSDYKNLEQAALRGNIQAVQARTAIVRELGAISNLHSTTLHTDTDQTEQIADNDKAQAKEITQLLLRKGIA